MLNVNKNTSYAKKALRPPNLVLTSTGNGTGVSTITLTVSENMTLSLDGTGKFYTDAGGTLGESSTWDITTGAARTMYLKVTSGTSLLSIPKNKITDWGAWTSSTNAASLGGDISKLTVLTSIECEGSNTISGNIALLTGLINLDLRGSNTLSGSIIGLTVLTSITLSGTNTTSGSIAGLTSLTFVSISGSNTVLGAITGLTSLSWLDLRGQNTVSGDLNGIVSDLGFCRLSPCAMEVYTSGATWGNANYTINPSAGFGYDATEIDNILIDMAASVALISKTITLQGSNAARTAASNAAVATLEGVGRTCTIVTNP